LSARVPEVRKPIGAAIIIEKGLLHERIFRRTERSRLTDMPVKEPADPDE
jgi:hypothetical protein